MARRVTVYIIIALIVYAGVLAVLTRSQWNAVADRHYSSFGSQNATLGANMVAYVLDRTLVNGVFTMEQLYDTNYQPSTAAAPGLHNAYDYYFDKNVRGLEDGFLKAEAIQYAYAVTADGYIPTSSQPEYNKVRLGHDQAGSASATPVQRMTRDAAGVDFLEYASPIQVGDQLWGEFRVGIPKAYVEAEVSQTLTKALLSTLFASVALAALVYLTLRTALRPLRRMAALSERFADGDLTVAPAEIRTTAKKKWLRLLGGEDEMDVLAKSFGRMAKNLRELVASIQEGIKELATSTGQISVTAKEAMATASEQASTVQQIGVTVEEINQTSRVVVDRSQEVVRVAEQAVEGGQKGIASVEDAREALQLIGKIIEIVETVNELAEQSNLLAVNASIEASKAGEQGRGFGVVASEVRNLAGQSKRAAKQIREILTRIEDSGQAISAASLAIGQLANVLDDSANRARQISGAAAQQSAGIRQIAEGMGNVVQGGRDTAEGAKQLEHAAAALNMLAGQLATLVGKYRT
jgi:methyl-accepting chemotaxis protein